MVGVLRHPFDVWRWFMSLRIEVQYRLAVAEFLNRNVRWVFPIPHFLFIFSAVILTHWDGKAEKAVESFILLQTLLGVVFLFFGFWSRVSACWLDLVRNTSGPTSAPMTIAIIAQLICIVNCGLQVKLVVIEV